MMKCKYCGGNLTLEQAYCPHCGRPNEEAQQHVKDMEHYKSNFEDTKSDVYEVAQKNTEIMSHTVIITVLVILCALVFVVTVNSWGIHRGLVQLDSKIQHSKYEKQLEQYLADEDYLGFSAFCNRHYIRAYDDGYEEYRLLVQTSSDYSYAYQLLMRAVTSEYPDQLANEISQLTDSYERIERVLHPTEEYAKKQLQELDEEKQQAIVRMEENLKVLYRTYFGMTEEKAENFGQMSKAQKTVFLEEKGEVMGYGKSVE